MKKIKIILMVFIAAIILSSCSVNETSIDDRLKAPKKTTAPIEGKWIVTDFFPLSEANIKEENEYLGQPALFHKDALIFKDYYTITPSFKMKKVNSVDYLLYKYKYNSKNLDIDSKKIEVLSISSDNQFFMEAIKDNQDNLFLYVDDGFYKLEKTEDEVSLDEIYKYIEIEEKLAEGSKNNSLENQNSGVLLGIKSSKFDEENNAPDWEYSTIWIHSEDKELKEIYRVDGILLPRKNGFWEIDINRIKNEKNVYDKIEADSKLYLENNKDKKTSFNDEELTRSKDGQISRSKNISIKEDSFLRNILYVGNNYMSTEIIDMENKDKRIMKMHTIDNLKNDTSINLEDVIDNGKEIFFEGAQSLVSIDNDVFIDESNIGLTRKNGYWMFKGRVNYEKNKEELYKDFIIKAVPPEDMVGYDNHFILWDELKRMFPNMIDMYSSPNEDIVVIRNAFELVIYASDNKDSINTTPLAKIELPESDSVVMAEWATQKNTEIWKNEIIKRDAERLE